MSFNGNIVLPVWRPFVFFLLAAEVMVAGCGGEKEKPTQSVELVQGLHAQRAQSLLVPNELEAPGTVIAVATAQVAARTMATVQQVAVREGDFVKRGQLLAQLDESELAARLGAARAATQRATAGVAQSSKAVAAAQAQADVVQKTYERYFLLKKQNSVSPQEFDEVSARQQVAQASLDQAKAGLQEAEAAASQAESEARAAQDIAGYARVTSPFDGRVLRRMVEPGTLISPGIILFIVEDTSRYQLEATLPAEALSHVKKSASARVQLDALPEKSLDGKVAEIEAGADAASHTLNARIDLPKDPSVQSGMFGRAFFPRGEKRALLAPSSAMVSRGQLSGVYVVDDAALVHWRILTLGKTRGNQVEVLSGLSDGDMVILNPGSQELDGKKSAALARPGEKRP